MHYEVDIIARLPGFAHVLYNKRKGQNVKRNKNKKNIGIKV